jgi:endoglycosylceramidase
MASHRHRPRLLLVALAVALGVATLAACSDDGDDAASSDEATTTTTPVAPALPGTEDCDGTVESADTRFIVDVCGRAVILRGVNVESASKGATQDDSHLPTTPLDAQRLLGTWGWNHVRFLVFWGAIEPEQDQFDQDYLDEVKVWLDWYAGRGIHVVLDMHQDLYGWAVGGNGAPDWAVDTRGLEPAEPAEGAPWYLQGADPAVQAAYQSFWNPTEDQPDLQAEYLDALAHLAETFADHPAVIGYDVMNEPVFANGTLDDTLAIQEQAAAGEFQNENLTQFMQGGIDAVRSADQDAWVMIEPTSLLNAFPYPGDLIPGDLSDPRDGPPRLAYAPHLYQQAVHDGQGYAEGDPYVQQWRTYRAAEAQELDAALWFGEWGGAPDQPGMREYIAEVTAMADEEMIGWAWWSWDPGGWSPLLEGGESASPNGISLFRVQPRAVAGVPTAFDWDPGSSTFRMTWEERAEVQAPTELVVPSTLFREGLLLVVDGETVEAPEASWDKMQGTLTVEVDRSLPDHELCLAPAYGSCA